MCARSMSGAMLTALQARVVRPVFFCQLIFPSGALNLWTGMRPITWNGINFTGSGTFGSISQVPETVDGSAQGIVLTLTGVPTSMLALAVAQQYQGGIATVWMGAFDVTTHLLITDPFVLFKGSMDVMSIQDGVKNATISVTCENRLIEYDRPRERRYTEFDQKIDFPTDTALQYVNSLQNLQIFWGDPNGPVTSTWGPSNGGIGALMQ